MREFVKVKETTLDRKDQRKRSRKEIKKKGEDRGAMKRGPMTKIYTNTGC